MIKSFKEKFIEVIMRLSDLVKDWVLETDLFEMAYQRKKAINIITGLQQPIARHVVKYLHYDASNETKNHWIAEINAWLYTIDEIKLKNPDVIIIDPTDELYVSPKDKFFYEDGIHLTAQGNEIIAEKIYKSIKKFIITN